MRGTKRCSVEENGRQCPRLATKSIDKAWICSRHWRTFKNKLLVEHWLGNSPSEARASAEKALREDESLELLERTKQK